MRVWIVNPFDPVPGDPEQDGRYATLARLLAARGHSVLWWTSAFSHRFKCRRDRAGLTAVCRKLGIGVEFLNAPDYYHNVGLRRIWNHCVLARTFESKAAGYQPAPEVVVASCPPPGLAASAAKVARRRGAAFLVDVQDLWPENFYRLTPAWLRPLARLLLRPMARSARRAYGMADTIVGVADGYVQRAVEVAGMASRLITIPLGVDLSSLEAARGGRPAQVSQKGAGHVWFIYSGSFTRNYDWPTVLEAAARLPHSIRSRCRFFLTGTGDLLKSLQALCRRLRLDEITTTGFLGFSEWVQLLDQCDVGINACLPEAQIFLPNKVFYYLAAGLAVVNSVPGQCSQMLRDADCGIDYRAGDPMSCAEAIEYLVTHPQRLQSMRESAARLGRAFDRRFLYERYVAEIERLGHPLPDG